MDENDRLDSMARWMWNARQRRQTFCNLPNELRPTSIAEAYAAQEVYYRLAEPVYGPVAGAKIATTTKVMQKLMGITHPCGGAIFARTIHTSSARLRRADFVNLRVESEIALKLGADLPALGAPWTRDAVVPAVASAMPAFELIEDRHADYNTTDASSLIVENCWNGGVVLGNPQAVQVGDLVGIAGRLSIKSWFDPGGVRGAARMQSAFDAHHLVGAVLTVDHRDRAEEALAADVLFAQVAEADARLADMPPLGVMDPGTHCSVLLPSENAETDGENGCA